MPLPAPCFSNITILNTFPFLPAFPESSFALVALRSRLREEAVKGVDPPILNTAEPQHLDDHRRCEPEVRCYTNGLYNWR